MEPLPESVVTARLTLRVWRLEDAPALAAAVRASREHLRPWMPWASEDTSDEHYERFVAERRAQWAAGGDATYGVFADGEVAGGPGCTGAGARACWRSATGLGPSTSAAATPPSCPQP